MKRTADAVPYHTGNGSTPQTTGAKYHWVEVWSGVFVTDDDARHAVCILYCIRTQLHGSTLGVGYHSEPLAPPGISACLALGLPKVTPSPFSNQPIKSSNGFNRWWKVTSTLCLNPAVQKKSKCQFRPYLPYILWVLAA